MEIKNNSVNDNTIYTSKFINHINQQSAKHIAIKFTSDNNLCINDIEKELNL
ncbi:1791_t:CDS:1, partial [Scutellospora calospora]